MGRQQYDEHITDYYDSQVEEYDPYDDYNADDYDDTDWEHQEHLELCERVAKGEIEVTPELIQSVTDPDWKLELIEAICLRQVNTKEIGH